MSKHDLTPEEIAVINKEIRGFMFEPEDIREVGFVAKEIKYVTGKKAEVMISIKRL